MEDQYYRQYNSDGGPIRFWIVGDLKNVSFLVDFLHERFLHKEINKETKEIKGLLHLGTDKVYEVEIKTLTYGEWALEKLAFLKVDIVAFYQEGDIQDSIYWGEQKSWYKWGEVKQVVFIEAQRCPAQFMMIEKFVSNEIMQQTLRHVLKTAQREKRPVLVEEPKFPARHFGPPPKKVLSDSEKEHLYLLLTEFLCLKFYFSGEALKKEIEAKKWTEPFQDWHTIRTILNYKKTPEFQNINAAYRGLHNTITVILPQTDKNPSLNFEYLKGAAYYPFQLEPEPIQEFAYDENCLIQLAFSTYYGYWTARSLLARLDRVYKSMSVHTLCLNKSIPIINEDDSYYELHLPKNLTNWPSLLSQNSFINKNDPKTCQDLFDYLLEIAQNGEIPSVKKYAAI